MNQHTPGPLSAEGKYIHAFALKSSSFAAGRCLAAIGECRDRDAQNATAALVVASYTAFDKAGRELGIDASTLAERIDLAALIRAVRYCAEEYRSRGIKVGLGDGRTGTPTQGNALRLAEDALGVSD